MDKVLSPVVLACLAPLVFTIIIYMVERRSWKLRNGLSVLVSALSFALIASQYKLIASGEVIRIKPIM